MDITQRLLKLARDKRILLAETILVGFMAGLLAIGQSAVLSRVVAGVFMHGQSLPAVVKLLQVLLLIIILRALAAWGSEVSANAMAVRIKTDLRQRLFEKLLVLGPAFTRSERTGELVNAAVEGVEQLDAYFSQYLPQLVIAALVPLSILVVIFPRDPLSGAILFITAPLIPVFMLLIGKTAERLTKRQWDTLSRLSAHFFDSIQGLRTLKEFGRSKEQSRSIADASNRFRDITLGVLRVTFLSALVLELVATISTALVAVEVGLRLLYGHLDFESALFLLLLAPEFYSPLRMLGQRFHAGMAGTNAAGRIFEILDQKAPAGGSKEIRLGNERTESTLPAGFSRLCLSGLSYTYPQEIEPALKDISLDLRAGEHIALVGPSGGGKSTLVALLLGFIKPDSGQMDLNNTVSSEITLETWRKNFAWVPQSPYLFNNTISANLRIAKPEADLSEIQAAVRMAKLDQFIQALPDGYETIIGEEGTRLSAGQAQRLALARAFLKNAPILILDEPTSNLDPEQEMLVKASLQVLSRDKAIISIAHRLNTVIEADAIYVMKAGRIVESGKHADLLDLGGAYAALVSGENVRSMLAETKDRLGERRVASKFSGITPNIDTASFVSRPGLYPGTAGNALTSSPAQHKFRDFWRLLGFLKGSWGWVALAVLLGALTVGSNIGLMGTAAYLISAAALRPEIGTLEIAIVGVRFFGISRGVFRYAERLTSHNVTFRVLARLRIWFYEKLEPLAPARLMQYRSGDLLSRIVSDVSTLEDFFVRVVSPTLVALLIAIGVWISLYVIAPVLAWTNMLGMLLLGVCLPVFAAASSRNVGAELIRQRANLQVRFVEGIQGLGELLAFGSSTVYLHRLSEEEATYGKTQHKLANLSGLTGGFTVMIVNLGMMAVLILAIPLVYSGRIPGVLLAVVALVTVTGFEAAIALPLSSQKLSACMQAARRLFDIVDTNPTVIDSKPVKASISSETIEKPRTPCSEPISSPALEFSGVWFAYPGNQEPALQDISFRLTPGKHIAVVGPSGAGKSSLANLLLRFWDYPQGRILLDGQDLHDFPQEGTRQLFSFISQRSFFFNDTIRHNLLLGCPNASKEELERAAQRAQIHDFIGSLSMGYETYIGERGLRLSGGERQRLALARAFLKDAPIFLLDEPTANLDQDNERLILATIFQQVRERSLLLITHRLVGLDKMDEILVIKHGRIIERGLQEQLLCGDTLFRELWESQSGMLRDAR